MGEYDADLRIFPDEFVPNVQASKVYQRWAKSSPGDRGRWEAFRDALLTGQEPSVPSMSTSFGRALVAAGKEHMSISQLVGAVTNPYPPPDPGGGGGTPPPALVDIDFAAGQYYGEGVTVVFEAYQSDPRLSTWGGTDAILYDQWGMTLDPNQRVYLTSALGNVPWGSSNYASWQELRTTDGPWASTATNLAKSTLNIPALTTWGGTAFTWGSERWFAFDIYFPLNVGGVSFEFSNAWNTLGDLHSNVGNADVLTRVYPDWGNVHPKYLTFSSTPDWATTAYDNTNLLQLTDSGGNRVTASFNTWHEVVIGVRAAYDSTGWLECWFDGVQKRPQTSTAVWASGETGPYAQLQNYTTYPTSYLSGATRSAIVYGGFRVGTSRLSVQRYA